MHSPTMFGSSLGELSMFISAPELCLLTSSCKMRAEVTAMFRCWFHHSCERSVASEDQNSSQARRHLCELHGGVKILHYY